MFIIYLCVFIVNINERLLPNLFFYLSGLEAVVVFIPNVIQESVLG